MLNKVDRGFVSINLQSTIKNQKKCLVKWRVTAEPLLKWTLELTVLSLSGLYEFLWV